MSSNGFMKASGMMRPTRSYDNLNKCFEATTNAELPCDDGRLFEKTPQFCTNQTTAEMCNGDVVSYWCKWDNNKCVLKDTGMTDLVKP